MESTRSSIYGFKTIYCRNQILQIRRYFSRRCNSQRKCHYDLLELHRVEQQLKDRAISKHFCFSTYILRLTIKGWTRKKKIKNKRKPFLENFRNYVLVIRPAISRYERRVISCYTQIRVIGFSFSHVYAQVITFYNYLPSCYIVFAFS